MAQEGILYRLTPGTRGWEHPPSQKETSDLGIGQGGASVALEVTVKVFCQVPNPMQVPVMALVNNRHELLYWDLCPAAHVTEKWLLGD